MQLLQRAAHGFHARIEKVRDLGSAHGQFEMPAIHAALLQPSRKVEQEARDPLTR
jgi:hypothetical protein